MHSVLLKLASFAVPTLAIIGHSSATGIEFEADVLPILRQHCFECHGADAQESGLRFDQRDSLLNGGDSGSAALVPRQPDASELLKRVCSTDADLQMPPDGARLTDREIELLRSWIVEGGQMPAEVRVDDTGSSHWSLQPIFRPPIPSTNAATPLQPIDAFVFGKLREAGLELSARAAPAVRIRRLFLVMHGLPPAPKDLAKWEPRLQDDPAAESWAALVDEVLESPRYGERWARHWLDIVRFGETHGFETNRERPNAWPYRDYVIDALNNDLPYDDFMRQQIAGDALNAPVATGFLVAGPHDIVKSPDPTLTLMQRQDELSDLVNVTGTTFLGLTLGCARCHNHKFDPVSQTDFYAVQAIFAGVNHADRTLPPSAANQQRLTEITKRIGVLRAELNEFIPQAGPEYISIDDESVSTAGQRGFLPLVTPAGMGTNPAGTARGSREDPGSPSHYANISGGRYTWWRNQPGQTLAAWLPRVRGRFRIWLSWGCGHTTHSKDARFLLDEDGDMQTTEDRSELAVVNQQLFADASKTPTGKALWSGFYNAGIHELSPASQILLTGGDTGTAVTADVLLLEPVSTDVAVGDSEVALPALRPAVNSRHNVDQFAPVEVRHVRFTITATNSSQPCIDELGIWSGKENVALAANGTTATSSGNLPGYEIHKLQHINDGKTGNDYSWISNTSGGGWVQLTLPATTKVERVTWGRDRSGRFSDRLATGYRIEGSLDGESWQLLAGSGDRVPFAAGASTRFQYDFANAAPDRAAYGRERYSVLNDLLAEQKRLQQSQRVYAGTFSQPGITHRLYRGDPSAPREAVTPDGLQVIGSIGLRQDAPEQTRRLQFAEWLASEANPLPARVIVNRLWLHHFGRGIVATPNDFGGNGVAPSHPELLDWLAAELIANDWSLKSIQRQILLSQTWQQSSIPSEDGLRRDAGSVLLWRYPSRRLEAEAIRDSILSVSGVLDLKMGGPGFSGFEVQMENVRHFFPKTTYSGDDFRRMVYMTKVRQEQESVFGAFDCPDASQVISRRSLSTTPLQALNLFNSTFTSDQSERLAKRLTAASDQLPEQIRLATLLCWSRLPDTAEQSIHKAFIQQHGLTAYCRAMLNSNEFVFVP